MSGTYSGSYNVAITLNSAHPAVTLSGTIDATGLAGAYDVLSSAGAATETLYTALFSNLAGGFSIYNAGLIENPGGDPDNTLQTGIALATNGSVTNAGTIAQTGTDSSSSADSGLVLLQGGSLTNLTPGQIRGLTGVLINGTASSYIFNAGTLAGSQGPGVDIQSLGSLTLVNSLSGTILSGHGFGLDLGAGSANAWNQGMITGLLGGISANSAISIQNAGTVLSGPGTGIDLGAGGTLFNSGDVEAWLNAITASSAATVQNSGTIEQLGATAGGMYSAGMNFSAGGSLYNEASGFLSGFNAAFMNGFGKDLISNRGTLLGLGGSGIYIRNAASATITNQPLGLISGQSGIVGYYAPLTVDNRGEILAQDVGIRLDNGGVVHNDGVLLGQGPGSNVVYAHGQTYIYNGYDDDEDDSNPVIYSAAYMYSLQDCVEALSEINSYVHFTNVGTARSEKGDGFYTDGGGVLVNGLPNLTTSLLIGGFDGAFFGGNAMITNYANIGGSLTQGECDGVGILGNADVWNYGNISGYTGVAMLGPGSTLFNAGTISGDLNFGAAVRFENGFSAQFGELIIAPGAAFIGPVIGFSHPGAFTKIRLTDPPGPDGTLAGVGTEFQDFNEIDFDPGAQWLVTGDAAGLAAGQTIGGFAPGDTIELTGFSASSLSYVSSIGLELFNDTGSETLDLTGSFANETFGVQADADGTTIALCYLRGTQILTQAGEVPVEKLRAGDVVVTRDGGMQKLRWIGRQDYAGRFIARNPGKIPVCIHPGALGGNQPARPLWVSPGHALLLGGTLVVARNLVNGITVTQPAPAELVEYYAIELAAHDCVMAEGAWAESYADGPGLRAQFHNAAAFYAAFPGYAEPADIALCAPRPLRGPALAAALAPVVARAAAGVAPGALRGCIDLMGADGVVEGWAQDIANPYLPVLLEVLHGERVLGQVLACDFREDLAAAGIGNGQCMFSFAVPDGMTGELRVRRAVDGAEVYGSEEGRKKAVAF